MSKWEKLRQKAEAKTEEQPKPIIPVKEDKKVPKIVPVKEDKKVPKKEKLIIKKPKEVKIQRKTGGIFVPDEILAKLIQKHLYSEERLIELMRDENKNMKAYRVYDIFEGVPNNMVEELGRLRKQGKIKRNKQGWYYV